LISAGALPQTPVGELTVLLQTQLDVRGSTSKGKKGRGKKGLRGGEWTRKEGSGKRVDIAWPDL